MTNGFGAGEDQAQHRLHGKTILGIALVSLLYFADIFLRASRKPFWLDELYTVYLCRLPTLQATLRAVYHGADFNPPLFYLFARAPRSLFGEGLIASRLPEIFGVWIFCLCLFIFVSRRLGALPGLIAGVFPFFTLIQYYAYEDRPHGLTVAWCGLALIFWQRLIETPTKWLWTALFTASMVGAVLTHVYAVYLFVPFALFEAYSLLRHRRIHWGIPVALVMALAVAIPVYLPLIHTFKQMNLQRGLQPSLIFATLLDFAEQGLGSSVYILLLFVSLGAFAVFTPGDIDKKQLSARPVLHQEAILALCFLAIPFFAIFATIAGHSQFYSRYALSALAGISILLAYASHYFESKTNLQPLLAGCMVLLMLGDLGSVVTNTFRRRGDLLTEPCTKFKFEPTQDETFREDMSFPGLDPTVPILDLDGVTFIYFHFYAPSQIVNRLSYGAPNEDDLGLSSYERLKKWANVDIDVTAFAPYFDNHEHFYVLNNPVRDCGLCLQKITNSGFRLLSVHPFVQGDMYEFEK